MLNNTVDKKTKHKYICFLILVIIIISVALVMFKYQVEGEKNPAFKLSEVMIISSAQTINSNYNEENYSADIIQKNDIYISIEKNEKYKKDDTIKEVVINNFQINKKSDLGNIEKYRTDREEKLFSYSETDKFESEIKYLGDKQTNLKLENMTIGNQGGVICFSIINNSLGNIEYEENEDLVSDGTLINKLNLNLEDLKAEVSFDVIIKLESGINLKTNIKFEIPNGNILEDGVCKSNIDINSLVFKRI